MKRPVDKEFAVGFKYGAKYPPSLAHLTLDGLHHGVDLLTPIGSVIYAPNDCLLSEYGKSVIPPYNYFGSYIICKFWKLEGLRKSQYRWICMHLERNFLKRLKVGDWIKEDSPIGLTGDSGSAAGHPHLHFEVQKFVNNKWVHVDPMFLVEG